MTSKRIIALAGLAGSGKSTVAAMLRDAFPFEAQEISFAEPLKKFCQEVFDFTEAQMFGPSEERNRPDGRYPRPGGGVWIDKDTLVPVHLTPRYALQTLGTEWGRGCYENVWADLGVRRAIASPAPIVVITDCRFVNEAKAVRQVNGEVWRIVRPESGLTGSAGTHPSEAEQVSPEFLSLVTRSIRNVGTLADLRSQIDDR